MWVPRDEKSEAAESKINEANKNENHAPKE
jgi:hypothetical protein